MPGFLLPILLLGVGAWAWWWLRRRRQQFASKAVETQTRPEVLSRDALLRRPRGFDPNGWDNSDGDAPSAGPVRLDREALARRPSRPSAPPPSDPPASGFLDRELLERRTKPAAEDTTAPIWDDEGTDQGKGRR